MRDQLANIAKYLRQNLFLRMLLIFTIPFVIYVRTLAPTIYNLDSAELTTAAATLGITRSTGYPLYVLIGHLWSLLPFGEVGYRMNLFSALSGSITLVLLDRILARLKVPAWCAWVGIALLAFSPFYWGLSLVAEVYTLHTALMALTIFMLLRWDEKPSGRRFGAMMFCLGLSLDHHLASLLLIPGIAWYIFSKADKSMLHPQYWGTGLLALLAALSIYAYIPIRYSMGPVFNYAGSFTSSGQFNPIDLTQFPNLFGLITGVNFRVLMFHYPESSVPAEALRMVSYLWSAFAGFGIAPGLIGLFALIRKQFRFGIMLVVMFFVNFLFYLGYAVVDKPTMMLPQYVIFSMWIAVGIQQLTGWVTAQAHPKIETISSQKPQWEKRCIQGLLMLAAVGVMISNYPKVDLSRDRSSYDLGQAILTSVKPDAVVIGYWDTIPVIQYFQLVEGQRRDVLAVNRFLIDSSNLNQLIRNAVGRRPVYIDSLPADLGAEYFVDEEKSTKPNYRIPSLIQEEQ